jgi:oligosaccharide repeat unit polymerase
MALSRSIQQSTYDIVEGQSYLAFWFLVSAFSMGLFALWSSEAYLVPVFIGIGYIGLFLVFRHSLISTRDLFNPLCVVFLICFIRYSCPGFLLMAGVAPPPAISEFYRLMGLSESDWLWAHVLTVTSIAGIALGWLLVRGQPSQRLRIGFSFAPPMGHAAVLGMVAGLAALVAFIAMNASLGAISTGEIRHTVIQEGTGVYFRLIYMMIAGSILLSAYLLARNRPRMALVPVVLCGLFLLPLGGRGRAVMPFLAGLLLQWYCKRQEKGWPKVRFRTAHVFLVVLILLLAMWLFRFGAMYRGGHGIGALAESLSLQGYWDYIKKSVFADFGQLHGLAGAIAIGPGVLGGQTFFGSLSWPLSEILPIYGRSAGIFIIETLVGFSGERRWGLHASLIGDTYLNFGLLGIMLLMPLFGMLSKLLYAKFRSGQLNAAIYVFAAVYGINLFLKSIDAWPYTLAGLVFIWAIIRLADFLNVPQRGFSGTHTSGISGFQSARNR